MFISLFLFQRPRSCLIPKNREICRILPSSFIFAFNPRPFTLHYYSVFINEQTCADFSFRNSRDCE